MLWAGWAWELSVAGASHLMPRSVGKSNEKPCQISDFCVKTLSLFLCLPMIDSSLITPLRDKKLMYALKIWKIGHCARVHCAHYDPLTLVEMGRYESLAFVMIRRHLKGSNYLRNGLFSIAMCAGLTIIEAIYLFKLGASLEGLYTPQCRGHHLHISGSRKEAWEVEGLNNERTT